MPIKVTMPALSPTMTEGNLAKWHKGEGDTVEAGDVICEIETDKATMEVEAVDEGILGKILVSEGSQGVPVNEVIAVLLEDGEDKSAIDDFLSNDNAGASPLVEAPKATKKAPKAASAPTPQAPQKAGTRIFATPLARRIAADKGIDLSSVKGSGPHGRIVRADLDSAKGGSVNFATPSDAPVGAQVNAYGMAYSEIPNNNIKKIIAKRLQESKQTVPHFYLNIDCNIDALLAARKDINDKAKGEYKLSVNDFIIKANAMALKAYPAANVAWSEDAIIQYHDADISVAVSTPNGLITPIVKGAQNKGLRQISEEIKDLATRARDGKLAPEEFQGGSFTVSNLGMFGIKSFDAIINPPQACILAVGAGVAQPIVVNGELAIGTIMSCTLSVDHRAVDGSVGAEYLQILKQYIENPVSMLI